MGAENNKNDSIRNILAVELLNTLVSAVNNVLWSYVLIVMLVGLGLWFSFRTGFVQLRHLREMVRGRNS